MYKLKPFSVSENLVAKTFVIGSVVLRNGAPNKKGISMQ